MIHSDRRVEEWRMDAPTQLYKARRSSDRHRLRRLR